MKKLLIVLVSVLLLLSAVSCEKDTTEEVTAVFEEFVKYSDISKEARSLLGNIMNSQPLTYDLNDLLPLIDESLEGINVTSASSEGSVTKDGETSLVTCQNLRVKYSGTLNGEAFTDRILEIGGDYSYTDPPARGIDYGGKGSFNLSLNGLSYTLTFTYYSDMSRGYTFTEATVNKKSVNLRLLNARFSTMG